MNKSVVFFAACLIAVAIYMSYFGAGFSIKGNIDEPTNTDKVSFNSSGVSMSEKAMHWHRIGNRKLKQGKNAEAEWAYYSAVKEGPSSDAYASLAAANYLLKKYDEAISNWEESIKLDKHNVRAWNGLSSIAYAEGKYSKAIEYSNMAFDIDKKSDASMWGLAVAYEAIGDISKASKYYKLYLVYSKSERNSTYAAKKLKSWEK